jgi:L-alanine-DL-glutamate epimerase-like enolase superfamily enzyme
MNSKIANAYIDFSKMTTTVVAVKCELASGREVIGYGFNSNGRYSAKSLMDERFIPRLLGANPAQLQDVSGLLCPFKCWQTVMTNEKPGGHGERSVAVGTLDMALWDALAKAEEKPLWKLLSERFNNGASDSSVEVYAAGGYYYPGKGVNSLKEEMQSYLDRGYVNVKMKIGGEPGQDIESALALDASRIEGVLSMLPSASRLAVDANGRFNVESAKRYADLIMTYGERILWYEEAGDPLDYALQAEVSEHIKAAGSALPMATGENLFSAIDSRNLLRYGGMDRNLDTVQFDCALSYGLVEYLRTLGFMKEAGWSRRRVVPHGGHQMSLNMAAGLQLGGNESYPDVFQPYSGFADHTPVIDGRVKVDDTPGIGFEANESLYQVMRGIDI